MKNDVLRLLRQNAKLTAEEIAERLNSDQKKIEKLICELEKEGSIKGYQALIDESVLPENSVMAVIEVKIRPEREGGFDKIAKRISGFSEVASVFLISGGYDLQLVVRGETLQDVAGFVSSRLSTIEGVISTATHFILKKYKEAGKILHEVDNYERLKVTP